MAQEGFDRIKDTLHEGIHDLKRRARAIGEFKAFILRGSALDLAVGVVIGAAFNTVVQSLVKDLLTPIISLPGTVDFKTLDVCLRHGVEAGKSVCSANFAYGSFLTTVISFLLTAAAVFFVVVRPMNKMREWRASGEPEPQTTRECPECLSKIPVAARRCAFCTTEVGAAA